MIYIKEHHSDSESIIKYSKFQWILFVIQKLMSSCVIELYAYISLSLYNGLPENFHINHIYFSFFNLWSKELIENISYPNTANQTDNYLDARILPT